MLVTQKHDFELGSSFFAGDVRALDVYDQ